MEIIKRRSGSVKNLELSSSIRNKKHLSLIFNSPNSLKKVEFTESSHLMTTQESQTTRSDSNKIKSFYQFLANCDNLQKDVGEVSTTIEQTIQHSKKEIDLEQYLKQKIRNSDYIAGLKKIEERIKFRNDQSMPKDLKCLKTIVSKNPQIPTDYSLSHEDITSKQAKDFLTDNKRSFGDYFKTSDNTKKSPRFKRKHSDIKINPQETIIEDFLYSSALTKPNKHKSSIIKKPLENSASTTKPVTLETKAKLPSLSLAAILTARARADANRLFTDRKIINNRIKHRKQSGLL